MVDKKTFDKFIAVAEEMEELDKTLVWSTDEKRIGCSSHEQKEIGVWQVPRTTAEFLRFLVLATKSKNILELGTSIGYSALWLAIGAKDTGGHVDTIEIFKPKIELAKKYVKKAGLGKRITIHEGEISSIMKSWGKKHSFDMVFLDADKATYGKYFDLILFILKKGGLIVADNVVSHSKAVKNYITKCMNDERVVSYCLNIGDGLMLTLKIRD